jgi:glycerol-1-phosphate dehydrogenase [NAD(P)+]
VRTTAPRPPRCIYADWEENIRRVYGKAADGIIELQQKLKWIFEERAEDYQAKWSEVREVLADSPTPDEVLAMLTDVGLDMEEFHKMYSDEKIADALRYAKDLKDRYTVLWMAEQLK